jgi:cold shock CspA family protein
MSHLLRISAVLALAGALHAQTQPAASPTENKPQTPAAATPQIQPERDPLFDPPPLPNKKVSLIGGTIVKLDPVLSRLTVQAFGGKKMGVTFDPRTQVFQDGKPVRDLDLKKGQRIYLDTMLIGSNVFAKRIWIQTAPSTGSGRGQVMAYDAGTGELTLRDELSARPAKFHLDGSTEVRSQNQKVSATELQPGSLVTLNFGPQQGKFDSVREVDILAKPGASFSFFGRITYLDLSRRMIAIDNRPDNKNYEVHLETIPTGDMRKLHEGTVVGVTAVFDGKNYVAHEIKIAAGDQQENEPQ